MQEVLGFLMIILIILGLCYIFVYNRLQRLSNSVQEASSGIDIALLKRYDLISSLVETVKGYSKHEREVFKEVAAIRNYLQTDRTTASEQMDETTGKLLAVVESYPELKASEQFLNLQKNMTNVEEHLQASRRLYNRSVTELNNVIRVFPTNIIANNHNIVAAKLFETSIDLASKDKITF